MNNEIISILNQLDDVQKVIERKAWLKDASVITDTFVLDELLSELRMLIKDAGGMLC